MPLSPRLLAIMTMCLEEAAGRERSGADMDIASLRSTFLNSHQRLESSILQPNTSSSWAVKDSDTKPTLI